MSYAQTTEIVERQPYFLGGEQRTISLSGETRISIIPQAVGMSVLEGSFEIALIRGECIEILGTYCTEGEIQKIVGEIVLSSGQ